jgi:hypothetical protein
MPDNDASDIQTDIANAATKPASATVDGNSVSQVSIDDKIKAANYTAGIAARTAGLPGLKNFKIRPTYE